MGANCFSSSFLVTLTVVVPKDSSLCAFLGRSTLRWLKFKILLSVVVTIDANIREDSLSIQITRLCRFKSLGAHSTEEQLTGFRLQYAVNFLCQTFCFVHSNDLHWNLIQLAYEHSTNFGTGKIVYTNFERVFFNQKILCPNQIWLFVEMM